MKRLLIAMMLPILAHAHAQTLDTGKSLFFDHHDGETTKMFMGWR